MSHRKKDHDPKIKEIIETILTGAGTEELVQQLYGLGPEAVTLALMAATRQIASLRAKVDSPAAAAHRKYCTWLISYKQANTARHGAWRRRWCMSAYSPCLRRSAA